MTFPSYPDCSNRWRDLPYQERMAKLALFAKAHFAMMGGTK